MFRRTTSSVIFQFFVFIAAALLIAWPSITYPWYGDDLHLIRVFSLEELRSAWSQTWDVDGLETDGYRPLTVVFNHARASAFGENVAAHRLFVITLFSVYLALIGLIGRRFNVPPAAMLLAGVMMVCAKYSSYHLVWIADGVHVAQGVVFALAALAILRWIESGATRWWCASLLSYVLSALIREDSLAIAPVLVGLALTYSRMQPTLAAQKAGLAAYAAGVLIVSVAALLARQAVLTTGADEPWTAPLDLLKHALEVVTLAGWHPVPLVALFAMIFALLAAAARRAGPGGAQMAWLWLFCAAVSAAPGVVVSRVNLLLFPITFYCLFAADILTRCLSGQLRVFGGWDRALAASVAFCCIALPAYESRRQQLSMAPGSRDRLEANCQIARGDSLAAVTPQPRRDAVFAELRRVGVSVAACRDLIDASGALRTDAQLPEGVFVPPRPFLTR